jgi:acetate kinase
MIVLVCNAGSTSLKFKLFDMPAAAILAQGKVERVGSSGDAIFQYINLQKNIQITRKNENIPDYRTGIAFFIDCLLSENEGALKSAEEIERVGFKTVLSKGYYGVHELTAPVLSGMEEWMVIAPAHNGPYLEAIRTLREVLPRAVFVGAFETAFHTTIPQECRIYGIPYEWYERFGVQKMGYHGASHGYVADILNAEEGSEYKAISCHMGGSGSICAIENGKSINNSFGLSLQTGIIHANRVGDMESDMVFFLKSQGLTEEEIREGLMKKGGLLGISGVSNDLRYIEQAAQTGNSRAKLAIDVYVNGILHYIGAYYAQLGGLDHLVFTGGIGENSATVRRMVCTRLAHLGIDFSEEDNAAVSGRGVITLEESRVKVQVIPANEELGVARRTYAYEQTPPPQSREQAPVHRWKRQF